MSIMYDLPYINHNEYDHLLAKLDDILVKFPIKHAITPFLLMNMPRGITPNFNKLKNKQLVAGVNTGIASGSMPASRWPGIAFMLMFAIGESNYLVPDILKTSTQMEFVNPWAIQDIFINALQSVLHFVAMLSQREFNDDDLIELNKFVPQMRVHLNELHRMKVDIRNVRDGIARCDRKYSPFYSTKSHHLHHFVQSIKDFGIPSIFDTQESEHKHIWIKGKQT